MLTITKRQIVELPTEEAMQILLQETRDVLHEIHTWKASAATPFRPYPLLEQHYAAAARIVDLIDTLRDHLLKEETPAPRQGIGANDAETASNRELSMADEVEKCKNSILEQGEQLKLKRAAAEDNGFTLPQFDEG